MLIAVQKPPSLTGSVLSPSFFPPPPHLQSSLKPPLLTPKKSLPYQRKRSKGSAD